MKYSLDSLQRYETNHSDALRPIQNGYDRSFMGDHRLLEQPTKLDMWLFSAAITSSINSLTATIHQQQLTSLPSHTITGCHHLTHNPSASQIYLQPYRCCRPCQLQSEWQELSTVDRLDVIQSDQAPQPAMGQAAGPVRSQRLHAPSAVPGYEGKPKKQVPFPDVTIKNIRRGPDAWLAAVEQWDAELKFWEAWMYTGPMREKVAMKRAYRETIAREYEAYGRDKAKFLEAYPMAPQGMIKLVDEIRRRRGLKKQRSSRNGTPAERSALRERNRNCNPPTPSSAT